MSKPVVPSRKLFDPCKETQLAYVSHACTDIRARFQAVRELQQPKAPNVRTLKAKKS